MKLTSIQDFLKLPPGTVYSDYEQGMVIGLFKKHESTDNGPEHVGDFFMESITGKQDHDAAPFNSGGIGRWALYEPDAQFLVYEKEDLLWMTSILTEAAKL
jgi:hypothetical protein